MVVRTVFRLLVAAVCEPIVRGIVCKTLWTVAAVTAAAVLVWSFAPRVIVAAPVEGSSPAGSELGASRIPVAHGDTRLASASSPPDESGRSSPPGRRAKREGMKPSTGDRGSDPSKRWPGRHGRLPEEALERCLAFLKVHWPERYEFLIKLRTENPRAFGRAVRAFGSKLHKLAELAKDNPELAKLEIEVAKVEFEMIRTARAYRLKKLANERSDEAGSEGLDTQAQELLNKLTELAGRRFELDVLRAERRMDHIADQLRRQRARLEQRRSKKDEEIRRTVKHMLTKPFPRQGLHDELLGERSPESRSPRRKWRSPGSRRHFDSDRNDNRRPDFSKPEAPSESE